MNGMASGSLSEYFGNLEDPRRNQGKRHQLLDIIAMTICAVSLFFGPRTPSTWKAADRPRPPIEASCTLLAVKFTLSDELAHN